MLRALIKIAGTLILFLLYLLATLAVCTLLIKARQRRAGMTRLVSFFAGLVLRLYGVRVAATGGRKFAPAHKGHLVVSNHMSYVDVLVIASLAPVVFVTSIELRNTPLLGQLARLSGSLFVERRKASGLKQEIDAITDVLTQGFSVVLFPEGTTFNGDHVHPFKQSLLDAAVKANCGILPVCIRYQRVNNEPLSAASRDAILYYGGTTFFRHFPRFLRLRSVEVKLSVLHPIHAGEDESRKHLAERAHEAISAEYEALA
jgi:1-acyl-sn-glycerol-3-phosphate acyltransferase